MLKKMKNDFGGLINVNYYKCFFSNLQKITFIILANLFVSSKIYYKSLPIYFVTLT